MANLSGRLRKLDTNSTVIAKLIRQQITQATVDAPSRNSAFVQNYSFSSGGGGSFGGGNTGTTTPEQDQITADVIVDGAVTTVTRSKLVAAQGTFLEDDATNNAVNLIAGGIQDPMYWLGA